MAAHIGANDANAWLESTKLSLSAIETDLEDQISLQIFAQLMPVFTTTGWVDNSTTPKLVKSIIAMYYAAAVYDRAYTDDNDTTNNYAESLRTLADRNIAGLLSGAITLAEVPDANDFTGRPSFFPTDLSSSQCPTVDNPSDGGPAFLMGQVF